MHAEKVGIVLLYKFDEAFLLKCVLFFLLFFPFLFCAECTEFMELSPRLIETQKTLSMLKIQSYCQISTWKNYPWSNLAAFG